MKKQLLAVLLTISAAGAAAQSPLTKVPSDRWGSLRPGPILEDSTGVDGEPGLSAFPFDLAFEGNYLYLANGTGIKLYDVSNPAAPRPVFFVGGIGGMQNAGLYWTHSDKDFYIKSIDVPPGNDGIAAVSIDEFGFAAWNTRQKNQVVLHYQDGGASGRYIVDTKATTLSDGREYAFALDVGRGVVLYDLVTASALEKCNDNTPMGAEGCGVLEGVLPLPVAIDNTMSVLGELLAVRVGATGLKIYRVAGPAGFEDLAPRMTATLSGSTNGEAVLWRYDYGTGEGTYLAALSSVFTGGRIESTLSVYDVTCVNVGACPLPDPLVSYVVTDESKKLAKQTRLTISLDGGKPYLYVGNDNTGAPESATCVRQREYPLDLSRFNPVQPPTLSTMDLTPEGENYWGWYYAACNTGQPGGPGFKDVRPRRAKVKSGYVFRAGYSFADAHRIIEPPSPVIFADGFESGDTGKWSGRSP